MNKTNVLALLIILISFIVAYWLYPILPDPMPSHWNIEGNVDGYMPKQYALFLVPVISLICFMLFIKLPDLDPKKQNIETFRKYCDAFILVFLLFFFYVYVLMILYSLNSSFNMGFMLIPAFAGLFFYIGILCENAKQNWFIGIRTPWTLSDETVWNKTHKVGGRLFKIAAIVSLAGMLFQNYSIWFVLVPILLSTIYVIYFSYAEFKKLGK